MPVHKRWRIQRIKFMRLPYLLHPTHLTIINTHRTFWTFLIWAFRACSFHTKILLIKIWSHLYLLLQQDSVHWGKHLAEHPGGHDGFWAAGGALDRPTGCCACGKFMIGALYMFIAAGPIQHRGAHSGRHPWFMGATIGWNITWGCMQQRGAHAGWQNCCCCCCCCCCCGIPIKDMGWSWDGGGKAGCKDLTGQHCGAHERLQVPSKSSGGAQHLGRQAG